MIIEDFDQRPSRLPANDAEILNYLSLTPDPTSMSVQETRPDPGYLFPLQRSYWYFQQYLGIIHMGPNSLFISFLSFQRD